MVLQYLNAIKEPQLSSLKQESPSTFWPKGFFLKKVGATGFEPSWLTIVPTHSLICLQSFVVLRAPSLSQ
jgi:hypothetical protein